MKYVKGSPQFLFPHPLVRNFAHLLDAVKILNINSTMIQSLQRGEKAGGRNIILGENDLRFENIVVRFRILVMLTIEEMNSLCAGFQVIREVIRVLGFILY